jgi:hypothetical protein
MGWPRKVGAVMPALTHGGGVQAAARFISDISEDVGDLRARRQTVKLVRASRTWVLVEQVRSRRRAVLPGGVGYVSPRDRGRRR